MTGSAFETMDVVSRVPEAASKRISRNNLFSEEGGVRGGRGSYGIGLHRRAGGYIHWCFFVFFSSGFLSVVFRVPRDAFCWLSGASWGLPGGLPDVIFGRISRISRFWG